MSPARKIVDFYRLFQDAPSAFMVLDRELRFIAANKAYLAITATPSVDDLLGRHIIEAFPHDPLDPANENATQLRESFERVFATGKTDLLARIVYTVPQQTPDGVVMKERVWSCTHTPIFDDDNHVVAALQQTEDITELEELRSLASTAVPTAAASVMRRAENVQAQNRLLDDERRTLRALLEQAPVFACFLRGHEHTYELVNAAYLQTVGHRDLIGLPVRKALPELEGQGFYELLDRVFTTREPFVGQSVPITLQRSPGSLPEQRYLDFTYQPIVEATGEVSGIFVIGSDVTVQVEAARARNQLATIVEQSTDAIAAIDPQGRIQFMNEGFRALLGIGDVAIHTLDPRSLFPDADQAMLDSVIVPALLERGRWHGEFRMRHVASGESIPVDYNVFILKGPNGEPAGAASVTRDLRERRAAEQERQFLSDAIPVHVWTADAQGKVSYVNARMTQYFGASSERLFREGWMPFVHPDDFASIVERWTKAVAGGTDYVSEARLRSGSGEFRWHLVRAMPFRDERGVITKWYGTNSDIDDQKRGNEERERLISALAGSNRELERFAYVASHDLKTPLRGIGNLAQWIEDDAGAVLSPQVKEHLALLRGRVGRMDALIDGVLKYSRSMKPDEHVQDVDVRDLLDVVLDLLAPPASAQIVVHDGMPVLRTGYVALQQVFLNLIGNALKHADRTDVRIEVRAFADAPFYRFEVSDNGPGISPEHFQRIWGLFQTLKESQSGAGIGLSVVKRLVELQGGAVEVKSSVGKGSLFSFTWPMSAT